MSNTDPTEKPGVNSGAGEGQAVHASHKTLTVLLIYTVKSGKSLGIVIFINYEKRHSICSKNMFQN
jgi:hypothetical protein